MGVISRLTQKSPLIFDNGKRVLLSPGTFSSYNAQATLHYAMWGMLLPVSVHERVSDIWRSYIMQRLMHDVNQVVGFVSPFVKQVRNVQDYHLDYMNERPLYEKTDALLRILSQWKGQSTLFEERFVELFVELYERDFIELKDVHVAQKWIRTLKQLSYEFPKITETPAPKFHRSSTCFCSALTNSSTPPLAAVCMGAEYTGPLVLDAATTYCAGSMCTTKDAGVCCQTRGAIATTVTTVPTTAAALATISTSAALETLSTPAALDTAPAAACASLTSSSTPALSSVCTGADYTGDLVSAAVTTYCEGKLCSAKDAGTCCATEAVHLDNNDNVINVGKEFGAKVSSPPQYEIFKEPKGTSDPAKCVLSPSFKLNPNSEKQALAFNMIEKTCSNEFWLYIVGGSLKDL
jgi:hypothetical protein